jgi:hypothetical protein
MMIAFTEVRADLFQILSGEHHKRKSLRGYFAVSKKHPLKPSHMRKIGSFIVKSHICKGNIALV